MLAIVFDILPLAVIAGAVGGATGSFLVFAIVFVLLVAAGFHAGDIRR